MMGATLIYGGKALLPVRHRYIYSLENHMIIKRIAPECALAALALVASPARAEEAATPPAGQDLHAGPPAEIVVTGVLAQSRQDVLSGVAVLEGSHLDQVLRPSIGETLEHTAGVSATSFGPTASRPVLRGMQGERVRVLVNGIGSIDVSNTSADHAPAVNPLLADRIEVLRGPQSLLYGSAAIGGVVNVIDRRIPSKVPDEPVHLGALATYGSAAKERSLAGSADVPLGGGWVAHADGSRAVSDDMKIGGYALTPALRAQALATAASGAGDPAIDYAGNANLRGRLPNTAAQSWEAGAGLAFIGTGGNIGLAYSHTDSLYGVPSRLATAPGQDQEAPRIKLQQDRFDARAEILPDGGFVEKISSRFAYAAYRHSELAADGTVGTTFFNHGMEGRIEVTQAKQGLWKGASGVQFVNRDFDVVGDEAFLPKNSTRQYGLFTVQQIESGPFKFEAGGRYERSELSAQPTATQTQFWGGTRNFDTFSASGGASWKVAPDWTVGASVSRTERAPAAEELFANGPHGGTQAYEVGDVGLKTERATSVELLLHGGGKGYSLEASVYQSWFADFIYEDPTGAVQEGLPVYQMRQAGARYSGFEVQGAATVAEFGPWKLGVDAMADYVRATIVNVGPAPRIPPLRALAGVGLTSAAWDMRAELEHVTAQNRIAANETPTAAYTLTNIEIGWRPWGKARPVSLTLGANNLFNVDARRAASFLKDYAPLAGRDIRLSLRLSV
jgi:iron complex outermembrane receptor protein